MRAVRVPRPDVRQDRALCAESEAFVRVPLSPDEQPGHSGVGTDMDIASVTGGSFVTLVFLGVLLIGSAVAVLLGKCMKFGLGDRHDD